ncbi:MAG: nitrous oxide reductase accessory protein NosL [Phycisphaerae bacterium]|nr:nitrous oxide reductase accessory protein NosL [Phycisphaerae bacterium]
MNKVSVALAFVAVASLARCGDAPPDGPPELRLGHDVCAHCGMMLAEDRCAAASIAVVDGQPAYLLWDDVGCLLDWLRERPDSTFSAHFVRDYDARSWVDAPKATFLMTEAIRTPMGSWIVAFASPAGAEGARRVHGGEVSSWNELANARVRWLVDQGRLAPP